MSQEKTTSNNELNNYRFEPNTIPESVHTNIASKHPNFDKEPVSVFPARDKGSYKGKIIHIDNEHVIQTVGNKQNVVVHKRSDIEIMGAALKAREQNNDLENRNLQIHYNNNKAKAYPWDAEKERAQREAAKEKRTNSNMDKESVLAAAQQYAQENIKNVKQREAFLKHLTQAIEPQKKPEQSIATKENNKTVSAQAKKQDHER